MPRRLPGPLVAVWGGGQTPRHGALGRRPPLADTTPKAPQASAPQTASEPDPDAYIDPLPRRCPDGGKMSMERRVAGDRAARPQPLHRIRRLASGPPARPAVAVHPRHQARPRAEAGGCLLCQLSAHHARGWQRATAPSRRRLAPPPARARHAPRKRVRGRPESDERPRTLVRKQERNLSKERKPRTLLLGDCSLSRGFLLVLKQKRASGRTHKS